VAESKALGQAARGSCRHAGSQWRKVSAEVELQMLEVVSSRLWGLQY